MLVAVCLVYTFPDESERLPKKLPHGRWNCSAPHYNTLVYHFKCNRIVECEGGVDETDCPWETCGQGGIKVAGKCFTLAMPGDVTWRQADQRCRQDGGQLAVLDTPELLRGVNDKVLVKDIPTYTFIGLRTATSGFPPIYDTGNVQWTDNSLAYQSWQSWLGGDQRRCGCVGPLGSLRPVLMIKCDVIQSSYLCERRSQRGNTRRLQWPDTPTEPSRPDFQNYITCPQGHTTHSFLACDMASSCFVNGNTHHHSNVTTNICQELLTSLPPSYACASKHQSVPFSLVCDHRADCMDESDESFCVFPRCEDSGLFPCGLGQCYSLEQQCDAWYHCISGADESECMGRSEDVFLYTHLVPTPPLLLDTNKHGVLVLKSLNESEPHTEGDSLLCPETHFMCPGGLICVPMYVRCNGVYDCPGHEDEVECDDYSCPGHYHCRASSVCVHPTHVCDGVQQCPQQDDELFCHMTCPESCTCHGLAFVCTGLFDAHNYTELRYLDASGTGMAPRHLSRNTMLVHLSLARCNITQIDSLSFPILRILDLSDNQLASVDNDDLRNVGNLRFLSLAGNPLTSLFPISTASETPFPELMTLDLSRVIIPELDLSIVSLFTELQTLNLSGSGVERVLTTASQLSPSLRELDIRGCAVFEFPRNFFAHLIKLQTVQADNYKLCCPAMLPLITPPVSCSAPSDEISSCDDLLRSNLYRFFLSVFAFLALLGNMCSFVFRVFVLKTGNKSSFGVFVTHLCAADFIMGLYLSVIGVADHVYQGEYIWNDVTWRSSVACKTAGFLSLLSNEASAFIICFITLDRFLVIRFPFSHVHFTELSAHLASALIWLLALVLAAVPLVPVTSLWDFYGNTGICIPLPITRSDFTGHDYAFGVMIVLNFILFMVIAAGQGFIYVSIKRNRMSSTDTSRQSQDLNVARRLITIAISDFLCWFPVGLLGILASTGQPIPGDVNVAMSIFVLPLNAALNPFLYTINIFMERRRRAREEQLLKLLMSKETETNH